MRRHKIANSQHGSTSSLAIFAESLSSHPSRRPLFDDADESSVPGNVHLLSDDALQRLLDSAGTLKYLRQVAKDLAERELQITEMRKRFEDRERKLKNMLYDSGVSRSEVERRLVSSVQRKPSSDSVNSGQTPSTFDDVDTLDAQLHRAMSETTVEEELHGQDHESTYAATPKGKAQTLPDNQNTTGKSAVPNLSAARDSASNPNPDAVRPRSSSSFSKWSTGILGWDLSRRRQNKPATDLRSSSSSPKPNRNLQMQVSHGTRNDGNGNSSSEDIVNGEAAPIPSAPTATLSRAWSLRTDLWPEMGAPLHYLAIERAQSKICLDNNNSQADVVVPVTISSTIARMALDLVRNSANAKHGKSRHAEMCATSSQQKASDKIAEPMEVGGATDPLAYGPQDPWSPPMVKGPTQVALPVVTASRSSAREPSTMEMATMIPDVEQPPTMQQAWQTNANTTDTALLTDRYGFKLFDARSSSRPRDVDTAPKMPIDKPARSQTISFETSSYDEPEESSSADDVAPSSSKPVSVLSHNGHIRAVPSISSPQPLVPETTLNKSDAVFSNENGSARLHMLTQLDLYGADKVKQELWDNFLRKTREDRRRPDRAKDDIIDQNEDELIGFASMGTGKMAKERRRELVSLVLAGIPIAYRPKIWGEMTGAYRLREPGYYEELLAHGCDVDISCVEQIELDLKRTMPSNVFFAGTGSGVPKLRRVLLAYSRHNPEVGYCQGMNVIAATLLLTHPTEEDAFFVLACIVEKILPERYFTPDLLTSRADQNVLKQLLKTLSPKIEVKLADLGIDLEAITFGWFLSVFTDCLPAEFLFRTWDIFFIEGHSYLFCTALAILKLHQKLILNCQSSAEVYTLLRELAKTKDTSIDEFVRLMEQVRVTIKAKGFDIAKMHSDAVNEMKA